MKYYSFVVFAFLIVKVLTNKEYPEISNEVLLEVETHFRDETDPDQKAYLEPVVRPERFDLNKDRKISKEEIIKALNYVIYPKDPKKLKSIDDTLRRHVKNNIALFVKNINPDYLS